MERNYVVFYDIWTTQYHKSPQDHKSPKTGCALNRYAADCPRYYSIYWPENFKFYLIVSSLIRSVLCVISGFRREVDENCALLGCYAVSSGNFLAKFRDNLSVPSSGVKILDP